MHPRERHDVSELTAEFFDKVADLPPEQRVAFLDEHLDLSNESDVAIRKEIERLLQYHDTSGILDKALIESAPSTGGSQPALEPGEVIAGRFHIRRMIAAGGMGEVYEAEDAGTRQTVALKTIRVDMADDEAQAERFRRELLISRNIAHRNVCKVYDYGEFDRGPKGHLRFFTMELLVGETLAQRLSSVGRLAPVAALAILAQVADGLDEVHRSGIIHRDLKPSNIFLVKEAGGRERAVVMDFGLARDLTEADLRQTRTGMIMGTRLYMPPELPKAAGTFSDIYSFGVVALEMVTGAPSPIAAPRSRVPSLDPCWDRALLACLNLDPAKRPASASAVVAMLRRRTRPWRRAAIAAGVALVCLTAGAVAWNRINPAPTPVHSATQITFDAGLTIDATSSADGKLLAYASDRTSAGDLNIWLQNMETGETRQITSDPGDEDEPTLSPDGKLIAWHSRGEDTISIRPVVGGTPRVLAKHGCIPRFSPDGRYIAYWMGDESERSVPAHLWVVPASGGSARNLASHFADARLPAWSSDSESILFRGSKTGSPSLEMGQDWWITNLEGTSIRSTGIGPRLRADGMQTHDSPVLWDGSRVIFAARAGHGTNLWSIRLAPLLNFVIGAATPITSGAGFQDVPAKIAGGRVAYTDLREQIHLYRIDLSSGDLSQITKQQSLDTSVSASADGQVLVFGRRLGLARNVWTKDLRTGIERELAANELDVPFVSPDGLTVAISTGSSIRLIDLATGRQSPECEDCGELRGWMPHGRELLYIDKHAGAPALRALNLTTKTKRALLPLSGLNEAAVSPDGKILAFTVRDGVHSEIFIAGLTPDGVTGSSSPITSNGVWADKPVWSRDGKSFLFSAKLDRFICIWRANIDTKQLRMRGEPTAVRHFHNATATLWGPTTSTANLAIGGGGLYLSVDESQSNIWAVQP